MCLLQIQQIKKQAESLKKEFQDQQDKNTQEVERMSEAMLLNVTELDDLYTYASNLADRRADRDILSEFDEVSASMLYREKSLEFEEHILLKTPYLHIGIMGNALKARLHCSSNNDMQPKCTYELILESYWPTTAQAQPEYMGQALQKLSAVSQEPLT